MRLQHPLVLRLSSLCTGPGRVTGPSTGKRRKRRRHGNDPRAP